MNKIKVVELFAGVGGFRIGLEGWDGKSASSGYKENIKSEFDVIWSNQFEPSTKTIQHANIIYKNRWPKAVHSEEDIEKIVSNNVHQIPDHNLLVGGFPCQDYSVAGQLNLSKGLIGKKGVLWWSIYTILKRKRAKPEFLLLENVPNMLNTPSQCPGRDFTIILSCLNELGYAVEWRVINSSDYGAPQKRRRVYLMCYHKTSKFYNSALSEMKKENVILDEGVLAKSFIHTIKNYKFEENKISSVKKSQQISTLKKSPFKKSGFMIKGKYLTIETKSLPVKEKKVLSDILLPIDKVSPNHFINFDENLLDNNIINHQNGQREVLRTKGEKWKHKKGSKKIWKINISGGYQYPYNEGPMNLFEELNKPSRTIITQEYSKSPNRNTHLIKQGDIIRNLTPLEIERLNMFPDDHTQDELITEGRRSFLMGNALVVGMVEKIGKELTAVVKKYGLT